MMTRPALALTSLAATLAYLGIAILGFGGFAAFLSQPPLIAVAIATLALSGVALVSRGNLSAGVREDRSNRWVLAAFGLIGLTSAFLPAYTDRIDFWTIDGEAVRWIGVLLFVGGGALRIWPVFAVGSSRSSLGIAWSQPGSMA